MAENENEPIIVYLPTSPTTNDQHKHAQAGYDSTEQMKWYLDVRAGSKGTSQCISCKGTISWCLMHVYTHQHLYLPALQKTWKRRVRCCLDRRCLTTRMKRYGVVPQTKSVLNLLCSSGVVISWRDRMWLGRQGFALTTAAA